MSPNSAVAGNTLGNGRGFGQTVPDVGMRTHDNELSPGQHDGVQEMEPNDNPRPAPAPARCCIRTTSGRHYHGAAEDVRYIYLDSNGLQKGVVEPATTTAATATAPTNLPPAAMSTRENPRVPALVIIGDPFADEAVSDEDLPAPLPHILRRGLQVPSRVSRIKFGFSFPEILAMQGIRKAQWKVFRRELKGFARLTLSQQLTAVLVEVLVDHIASFPVGVIAGWKVKKHKEHENFLLAYRSGQFTLFEDRWNKQLFHPLGLHVRIYPPGVGRMDGMDVSSTKLFKYQHKMAIYSDKPGVASARADWNERRYEAREGPDRVKAARKGRVVIVPRGLVDSLPPSPSPSLETGSTDPEHFGQGILPRGWHL